MLNEQSGQYGINYSHRVEGICLTRGYGQGGREQAHRQTPFHPIGPIVANQG